MSKVVWLNRVGLFFLFIASFIALFRWIFPERPLGYVGFRAILDNIFALGFLIFTLIVAGGLGWKIIKIINPLAITGLEEGIFSLTIGLGILAYAVFALGLAGLLKPLVFAIGFIVILAVSWTEWNRIINAIFPFLHHLFNNFNSLKTRYKITLVLFLSIFILTLIQALTPPWDYDGLMYHLQGPRLWLEKGRIDLLPDLWQANGANLPDMLYLLGLAFGSSVFSKLIHLSCSVILVLSIYAFGQRHLKSDGGWISVMIFLGMPMLLFWASWAYTDMACALFELLSLFAILRWTESRHQSWLILTAILAGFSIASKYLALGSVIILGLWLVWNIRSESRSKIFSQTSQFVFLTLLIGAPFYIKNWVLAGNPIYPFVFGGPGWDQRKLDLLMAYLFSFGTGRTFEDFILLPLNIYTHYIRFAGTSIEIPNLLFPFLIMYPFIRQPKLFNLIAIYSLLRFFQWAVGSQQTRFLIPVFCTLSILVASLFTNLSNNESIHRFARVLISVATFSILLTTVIYAIFLFHMSHPLGVIFGSESKKDFLQRIVHDYSAFEFIKNKLPSQSRVLMLWDGRGFYCDARCIPDSTQSRWPLLYSQNPSVQQLANNLHSLGITHLLLSYGDVSFFLEHDVDRTHRQSLTFFFEEFRPACLQIIYSDRNSELLELTCP